MDDYKEIINFLYHQFPQYQQLGEKAYKKDLSNIRTLCNVLGDPHKDLPCIHIAGTNGKGSVAHMLASIFQEAGYQTGIYTSPHLIDFRERIKINGELIPKEFVIDFVNKNKTAFKKIGASFFEWTTALAFYYFKNKNTDINIIETGLGGRLDSTNIIHPQLSIITTIGLDHQNILGNTLKEIAREKAGIIKNNTPVVLGPQITGHLSVFMEIAHAKSASLLYTENIKIETDLIGSHQQHNGSTVFTAYQALKNKFNLTTAHFKNGLNNVIKNTSIRGRWEILNESPLTIADIGHNQQAFEFISKKLNTTTFNKGYFVIGFSDDKDIGSIINLLPKNMNYIITQPNNPRAKSVIELKNIMGGLSIDSVFENSVEAYTHVKSIAKKEDLIFIGGSAFLVADILSEFFPT